MEKKKEEEEATLTPSNLIGVTCPGTMHSGPAASTMASNANPLPTGFGCCKIRLFYDDPEEKDK